METQTRVGNHELPTHVSKVNSPNNEAEQNKHNFSAVGFRNETLLSNGMGGQSVTTHGDEMTSWNRNKQTQTEKTLWNENVSAEVFFWGGEQVFYYFGMGEKV